MINHDLESLLIITSFYAVLLGAVLSAHWLI